VTIKSSIDYYELLYQDVVHNPARGDMPRELEDAIDRTTKEEFEAEFRRQYALRWLYRNGGMTMNDGMQTRESKARILEERDIPAILDILLTEEDYRKESDHIKEHLTNVAKGGLDRYSNNLVAERDGKAVGRAVIDTPYPPYAELAGLIVHPKYRGEGVGTELVDGCVSLARNSNCDIIYVMAFKDDPAVLRFYQKHDFQPAILQGFDEDEKEICLFRFSDTPCYNEFLKDHQMSVFSVSGGKVDFHGKQAYEMRWRDPETDDFLAFYLDGNLKKDMPRITGVAIKEDFRAFDAWINLGTSDMAIGKPGEFDVCLENKREDMNLRISYLIPKGTTIDGRQSNIISSELKGGSCWNLRFDITQGFDVPPLSFYTVLATCQLQLDGFSSPFPISAGFEVKR